MATQSVPARSPKTRSTFVLALDRYFYFGMSLLVAVVVTWGFSHTVDQNLIHATPERPWILWVHGIVMTGWLAFFIFQSALVRTHNVKLHRLTGWFGAGLAATITVLGIATSFIMDRFQVYQLHTANYQWFFSIQIWDMIAFTTCFWLAVYWRKKPEYHRRLILVATCALTAAGWGRFSWLGPWFYAGVDALIILGVVRDLIVNRRIHVIYRYALPAFVVAQIIAVKVLWLGHPQWWERLTGLILR